MKKLSFFIIMLLISSSAYSQFRENGAKGLNVFETPKTDTKFDGIKVKIGGDFTVAFQALEHSNLAKVYYLRDTDLANLNVKYNGNELVQIVPGFNTPTANLNFNVALADGIDMSMELYLSSRHNQETWVKGGYIQFNKVPFIHLDLIDNIMKYSTVKVGYSDLNYGDAHFRRTDNGKAIYNPFVENYIMDEFTTEAAAEININYKGIVAVAGITSGQIQGDISKPTPGAGLNTENILDTVTDGSRRPAFLAKLGYDGKFMDNKLRFRATSSLYYTAGSTAVTLFGGDRCGSHYWGVMDNTLVGTTFTNQNEAYTSGRYDPQFNDKVTTVMANLFLDYQWTDQLSMESFSTLEAAKGRGKYEATGERVAKQLATDLILRYNNFYLGARYNVVDAEQYLAADLASLPGVVSGAASDAPRHNFVGQDKGMYNVKIKRTAISAGWFLTNNILAKIEYTSQKYHGFVYNDIRSNGQFSGFVAEAIIGF